MASVFFYFVCVSSSDQMIVQRYLSTPSLQTARRSVWVYIISNLTSIVFLAICGLSLFAYYSYRSSLPIDEFQQQIAATADRTMLQFVVQELPHGIAGLIVAGLLAAAMSGLSSGMNAIASVLIKKVQPEKSRIALFRKHLVVERLIGIVMGAFGVLLAVGITLGMERSGWNLVELSGRVVNLFVGPLAVLFFAGMLIRRSNSISVLIGFTCSVLTSFYIGFSQQIFGLEQQLSFIWIIPVSFVVGFGITAIISLFLGRGQEDEAFGPQEDAEGGEA